MALTKNLRIYVYILTAALALTACAKKSSEFSGRKSASGASYVNPEQATAADNAAKAMGYDTDIKLIQNPTQTANGTLSVNSYLQVNSNYYMITTTHSGVGVANAARTSQTFDGANFEVYGVCANTVCSPYYLVLNITKNGTQIKQTAMKKNFYYDPTASQQGDLILSRGAGQFLSLQTLIDTLDSAVVDVGDGADTLQ